MNVFDQSVKYPFPIYRQIDPNDAGRACLRMISRFYGVDNEFADLGNLVQNKVETKESASLLDIYKAAVGAGFKVLSAVVSYSKLEHNVPLPVIVHWKNHHFIIVYQILADRMLIADPAVGFRNMPMSEFLTSWTVSDVSQIKENKLNNVSGVVMVVEPSATIFKSTLT